MTQTNEEIKQKIMRIISMASNAPSHSVLSASADEIISLIPQPEQLEVEIRKTSNHTFGSEYSIIWRFVYPRSGYRTLWEFDTKQEALDFCKRFNLKVVNEDK